MLKSRQGHKEGTLWMMSLGQLVILYNFRTYRPDPSCGTAVPCTEEAGSTPSITKLRHCALKTAWRAFSHRPTAPSTNMLHGGWEEKGAGQPNSTLHPSCSLHGMMHSRFSYPVLQKCQCQTHLVSPHSN